MSSIPTGTVTFLFTDIQGSTDLAQAYPDAMPSLLARHNAILRRSIESHNGYVFRIAGDSFSCAFHTAPDALSAALNAQQALYAEKWDPAPVRVRMGFNTGSARAGVIDDLSAGYEGYSTLARAQRVMATAHGGQILVSNSSAELIRDTLPPQVSLRDMGEHKLKGLIAPEQLWQVVTPELPDKFPPLETLDFAPGNLPVPLNTLVGRTRERAEAKSRLEQARLLTLLGPGGIGKTRLTLQVAWDLRPDYQNRVYFVDLAPLRDTNAVLSAIGRTIGLRDQDNKTLVEELQAHIKHSKLLLLLDNFEQVIVAAPAVAELLADCPELRLLVTSREALHVRGEQVLPIPPLALPPPASGRESVEQIAQSEAVQLFVARARAVNPTFELTQDNAQAVAEICRRLDGLPLAIELATARLNVFPPRALAERLGNRLNLLRGGARDLPARQQTLRDTIDWSYEMLRPAEQDAFKALSVYSGATFTAVESSLWDFDRFRDADLYDTLSSLVDKSLVRQLQQPDGQARFLMLETIREFASARLAEDEPLHTHTCLTHATYFADFAFNQRERLFGTQQAAALQDLATELQNIKTSWSYWAERGNLEQLNKMTDSLWMLYDSRSWYHQTIQLTRELLAVIDAGPSTPEYIRQEILLQTSLARALLATRGYSDEVEQAYARALELCDTVGEIPEMFPVLRGLSSYYTLRFEHSKCVRMGERILALGERLNDPDILVEGHFVLGQSLASTTSLELGLEHLEKSIAGFDITRQRVRRRGLGSNSGVVARAVSGLLLWMAGFPDRARRRAAESVSLAKQLDHPFSICYALFHSGLLHSWLREPRAVIERADALQDLAVEYDFQIWAALSLCLRGASLAAIGSAPEGLVLLEQGIQAYRGLKSPPVFYPLLLSLHAGAYAAASQPTKGLALLDQAIGIASSHEGRGFGAELVGLKGDLLLASSPHNAAEAESFYQMALGIAQADDTLMTEVRVSVKLAELWIAQGNVAQAHALLQSVHDRMTEGFDIPDMARLSELLNAQVHSQ